MISRREVGTMSFEKYQGHLAGPYAIVDGGDKTFIVTARDDGSASLNSKVVAEVVSVANMPTALLLADAPALLERCKRLERALERIALTIGEYLDEQWDGGPDGWVACIEAADAALRDDAGQPQESREEWAQRMGRTMGGKDKP
jgi:hypothetical protein